MGAPQGPRLQMPSEREDDTAKDGNGRGLFRKPVVAAAIIGGTFSIFVAFISAPHWKPVIEKWARIRLESEQDLARRELKELNIPYKVEELLNRARRNDTKSVHLFLTAGMIPNVKDEDGCTPLIYASEKGNLEVLKLLLDRGAHIDCRDNAGRTPLMCASLNGHEGVAGRLLEKGADPNVKDNNGKTPLMLAAKNGHTNVMELLKNAGVRSTAGKSPH